MAIGANEVSILITAKDQFSKAVGGIQDKLGTLAKAGALAGVAFAGVTLAGVADMVKDAADEQVAAEKLRQAIQDTAAAHGDLAASQAIVDATVAPFIAHMRDLAFADKDTQDALALLVAQTGDADDIH